MIITISIKEKVSFYNSNDKVKTADGLSAQIITSHASFLKTLLQDGLALQHYNQHME